jgi:glycosyltransferase involved in cell wall biosynthesis
MRDRPRILSLSISFPNPNDPMSGVFVRSRLEHMARAAEIRVLAPIAVTDYGSLLHKRPAAAPVPRQRRDHGLEVLHPRWAYPPLGTFLNAFCLFLCLVRPVGRLRREFPFQVIDAHFGHPAGVAAALLGAFFHCPFVVTLRGDEVVHACHRLRRFWMGWALRRASRVITVSERLRQFALSLGVAAERTRTIPNGVDTSVFFPRAGAESRGKHGIPVDARVVVSAGALIELKGHHRTIRAVKALRDQGIRAQLLVVGPPARGSTYDSTIRSLISELGMQTDVRLLGHVTQPELAELMSAADVLCLASSREGWPNVIQEALSCGTPVVATDVGAVPNMIPASRYGLVVPVDDQAALTNGLRQALSTEWDRQAIALWGQSRSWDQVALEVLQVLEQVLTEPRKGRNR